MDIAGESAGVGHTSASASVLACLRAVVAASERLVAEADLKRGIDAALATLRLHTGLDRVYVFRDAPGAQGVFLYGESLGPGVASIREHFGDRVYRDEEFPGVIPPLREGEVYQSVHPQRHGENEAFNAVVATRSDLMVPVIAQGRFWGCVGFDDCQTDRGWNAAEVAALQGAASAIAAAVLRDAATAAQKDQAQALAMRDRLLAAVAQSMQDLLGSEGGRFADAVRATLGALGQACGIHRVKVILQRRSPENGEPAHVLEHEWWAPGLASQTSLGLTRFPNHLIPEWTAVLERGQALWNLIDDVPAQLRAAFEAVGVRSVGAVPIFGADRYLGLIAFDDCVARRVWSAAEIDALTAAARTIGGAIHQHQLQQAMLEERDRRIAAERLRADDTAQVNRLLEGVVAASRVLLEDDNFEAAMRGWLAHLAGAVDADRANYGDFAPAGPVDAVGSVHLDWSRDGLRSTENDDIAATRDFQDWGERLQRGETIWAHRDELRDPVSVRYWEQMSCWTNLIVPVVVDQTSVGWLGFDFATRREWNPAYGSVLRTAADAAAAAIKRRWAVEAMLVERDRRIELEHRSLHAERARALALKQANDGLIASTSRLAALKDIPAFLDQLLLSMTRSCGARTGTLFTTGAVDRSLRMRRCVMDDTIIDIDSDERMRLWREPLPDWLSQAWHAQWGSEALIRAPLPGADSPDEWPENTRWHAQFGHRLRLRLPLNVGGELLGIIVLSLVHDEAPGDFVLQQAVVLAQQAAIAMQMERLALLVESSAVRSERERMAAEIHDSLAQSFTSIAMQSESLAGLLAAEPEKSRVLRLIERTAREGLSEARRSVLALMPADGWPGSLDQSLAALAERSSILGGIVCRFASVGRPCGMPGAAQESLLRIAQEATGNAMRHSGGSRVLIQLDYDPERLRLTIEDDGRGMPAPEGPRQSGGFGLSGMSSRAAAIGGTVSFGTSALGGVSVCVELPCPSMGGAAP